MSSGSNIFVLIRPFLKGWPVIVLFLGVALALGARHLYYAIPMYQASAALQINDKDSGASNFLKGFEAFSLTGALLTEVEVLRSKYLVSKAIDKLDVQVMYFRYVRTKKRNLYKRNPFRVTYTLHDTTLIDKHFQFYFHENGTLDLIPPDWGKKEPIKGWAGKPISTAMFDMTIARDSITGITHPEEFRPDHYGFTIHSKRALLGQFANEKLKVSLPEKEVAIVKLYYAHEVPELAADMVNTLADTYIEDFVNSKKESASQALNFIDEQVSKIEEKLEAAEDSLSNFKSQTKVVDLALETDSKLKRIGELEIRKLTLELQQTELKNLLAYITSDSVNENISPNYESVEDPAFTDALIKISTLKNDREALLQKYTLEHPELIKTDNELERTRLFLSKSVANTLATNKEKIADLNKNIRIAERQFGALPEIERNLLLLKRRFMTNELVYTFLLEKRAEASIGAASTISFHKVLERAPVPKEAISPQKSVIIIIAGMVGAILGFGIIFFFNYIRATIYSPEEIEAELNSPVIGVIKNIPNDQSLVSQDFINLVTNIQLITEPQIIVVGSYGPKEGKSRTAINLAKAVAAVGYSTVIVDADLYNPIIHEFYEKTNEIGLTQTILSSRPLSEVIQQTNTQGLDMIPTGPIELEIPTGILLNRNLAIMLEELKQFYEKIIINAPVLKDVRDAISLMKLGDFNLLVTRADKTRMPNLFETEQLLQRFDISNLNILLIQQVSQTGQTVYQVKDGELPRIGQGARRRMVKDLLRWALLGKNPEGEVIFLPKIGKGTRRKIIFETIKNLFSFKKKGNE